MSAADAMKVLVVEDDRDTQESLCDILELDGCTVDSADSLAEALKSLSGDGYAVVLLDRRLPDGTAEELLPRLRESAPKAAVIIVTAYADLDHVVTALRHGVADYVLKPVKPDALRSTLARITHLREAEARAVQNERLTAVGDMMAVLVHESRNAFQLADGARQMLARRLQTGSEEMALLEQIGHAQVRLHRLFEDVRQYAGPIRLDADRCNLADVLHNAWDSVRSANSGRTLKLQEQTNRIDLHCVADAFRIEQVFRNLLDNAVTVCGDPVCLDVAWAEAGDALRFALRDNGPGFTDEARRQAFEPFFTTRSRGTGLGLAISKRIIDAHGGRLEIGPDGPGAELVITLPRNRAGVFQNTPAASF